MKTLGKFPVAAQFPLDFGQYGLYPGQKVKKRSIQVTVRSKKVKIRSIHIGFVSDQHTFGYF
jgi:hypothetical protein